MNCKKKITDVLGRFLHRQPKTISSADEREALMDGRLRCPHCKHDEPLSEFEALQMVECGECGEMLFIPLKINKFWLFEPLGGGGMGSVYKAWHEECGKQLFAVKVLSRVAKSDPACINALLTESETAKQLSGHRSVVQWAAGGFEDGEYFCAMEYVKGQRLDEAIEQYGHLSEKTVLGIALHILAAEQHLYEKGFLYRDMKPENVMIDKEQGRAVLLDFGLCLPLDKAMNPEDEFVYGSPYYIPPERLWGTGESAASEIYSIGMVMYYALKGKTYYDAGEVEALAKRHVSNLRVAVSSKMRGFRTDVVQLLTTMMEQDRTARFQSFPEAARAVYDIYQALS